MIKINSLKIVSQFKIELQIKNIYLIYNRISNNYSVLSNFDKLTSTYAGQNYGTTQNISDAYTLLENALKIKSTKKEQVLA